MNILVINGTRSDKGQTAQAAGAFMAGATGAGATCRQEFLPLLRIERCRQCDEQGWGICRSKGQCVIEDDFALLVEKIRQSQAVAFATPVYFSDLSESLRAFLDRLRRTSIHPDGKAALEGKVAVGICVAGGGGGGAPACTLSLEKVLTTCGFDVVDVIPVRRQNLPAKREILQATGRRIATEKPKGE